MEEHRGGIWGITYKPTFQEKKYISVPTNIIFHEERRANKNPILIGWLIWTGSESLGDLSERATAPFKISRSRNMKEICISNSANSAYNSLYNESIHLATGCFFCFF